jgi:hypothetical protein
MKKILFMLFVILGISLQNVIAQNDSVVLPDYMYKYEFKHYKEKQYTNHRLKTKNEYSYDEKLGRTVMKYYYTIDNKKPVRVENTVSYNNTCNWWYIKQSMVYSIESNIVGSYCINDDECIIFVKTMEFYKFRYSDSSITYVGDLSESGLFNETINYNRNETIKEVEDVINKNPNSGQPSSETLEIYYKFRGVRNIQIGRMESGNLTYIDGVWFLSFQYYDFTKPLNDGTEILLRSIDNMKTWTRSKVYLNYMYKQYDVNLKKFIPFLLTFENNDGHLTNIYKINNVIYFSDIENVIYKSVDNGNIFKLYKIFKPFPTPVVPTFENTNH